MSFPPPPPSAPRGPNPLADFSIADWARDGGAFVLLLVSLALPWSVGTGYFSGTAPTATNIWAVLATLISVASIGVTYLAKFRVIPSLSTLGAVTLTRLLLNAPYALLVLISLLAAGVTDTPIGAGASVGFAGAVLAAQPRDFEMLGQRHDSPFGALWRGILIGFTAATTLGGLVAFALNLIELTLFPGAYAAIALISALLGLTLCAGVVIPSLFAVRGSESARRLLVALGFGGLAFVLLDALTGHIIISTGLESLRGGVLTLWVVPLLAVATSPALRLTTRRAERAGDSAAFGTVGMLAAVASAAVLVVYAVLRIADGGSIIVANVMTIVLVLVVAAAALILRKSYADEIAAPHTPPVLSPGARLGILIGLSVLSLVIAILAPGGRSSFVALVGIGGPAALLLVRSLTDPRTASALSVQTTSGFPAVGPTPQHIAAAQAASVSTGFTTSPPPPPPAPTPAGAVEDDDEDVTRIRDQQVEPDPAPATFAPAPAPASTEAAEPRPVVPYYAWAPTTRIVYDEAAGSPLFEIGPEAWAVVVEERGDVLVVSAPDGRRGLLYSVGELIREQGAD